MYRVQQQYVQVNTFKVATLKLEQYIKDLIDDFQKARKATRIAQQYPIDKEKINKILDWE